MTENSIFENKMIFEMITLCDVLNLKGGPSKY